MATIFYSLSCEGHGHATRVRAIEKQRNWLYKCPGCWAECEVLPSAIYTGDLLKRMLAPDRSA